MNLLEIAILPGKGRGYKALTDIPAGTTIHISEPLATTVSQEWTPETCMWCFGFSYPKKQKVKAVNDQEQALLLKQWSSTSKGTKKKNAKEAMLKDLLFCSEGCKSNLKSYGYQPQEWNALLTAHYRLDEAFKNSGDDHINIPPITPITTLEEGKYSEWIDVDDDKAPLVWLDNAWDALTNDFGLCREMDQDADKSMCRLIAACIIRKLSGETQTNDVSTTTAADSNNTFPQFDDLLVIQNNETTHFKNHFNTTSLYPHHPNQLPILDNKQDYLSIIPLEVLQVMALYCFFARALCTATTTTTNFDVPTLPNVDHQLFRSIYFRENANSFGLWEMGHKNFNETDGGVTDDLELLGWGIYPSAVYFNHSCDANVYKVREGRNMVFVTRRMIYKGEEACISYGSVEEDVTHRRARLLEHYHFVCQCTRCIEEEESLHHKLKALPPR